MTNKQFEKNLAELEAISLKSQVDLLRTKKKKIKHLKKNNAVKIMNNEEYSVVTV